MQLADQTDPLAAVASNANARAAGVHALHALDWLPHYSSKVHDTPPVENRFRRSLPHFSEDYAGRIEETRVTGRENHKNSPG
jgi:hypothetical protein